MVSAAAAAGHSAMWSAYDGGMPDLTANLPTSLRRAARWRRLGPERIPVMLVHPQWTEDESSDDHVPEVPVVLWMHGRTVHKEIDPGRYLRWLRAGFAACAIDLPGHGERFDASLQQPDRTLEMVIQMSEEIDSIVDALGNAGPFDLTRVGIGGMSAGGMATMVRLCRDHSFRCTSLEATTGSWQHQRQRAMFRNRTEDEVSRWNPYEHLDGWREIPVQAIHSRLDEWVSYEGQVEFLDGLRSRYRDPSLVELVSYDRTGAPYEHAGFGLKAADAKNQQRAFLEAHL